MIFLLVFPNFVISRITSSAFRPWTEGYHSDSIHLLKLISSGLSFQTLHYVFLKVLQCRLSLIFCLSVSDIRSINTLSIWFTVSQMCRLCFDSLRWYGNIKIYDVSLSLLKYLKKLSILHFYENRVLFRFSLSLFTSSCSLDIESDSSSWNS